MFFVCFVVCVECLYVFLVDGEMEILKLGLWWN